MLLSEIKFQDLCIVHDLCYDSAMNQTRPNKTTAIAYLIFFLGCFLYVYGYILRVIPSTMTTQLMQHFSIEAGGLGLMAAMFFWGYTPMQVLAGLLYDWLGTRVLMTLALVLCTSATILFTNTNSIVVANLCRLAMGISAAFGFGGALLLAARWLPTDRYAFWAGFVQLLGALGAIVGLAPIAALTDHFGWQTTLYGAAALGLLFTILVVSIVRNKPKHQIESTKQATPTKGDFKTLLSNRQTWWVGMIGFCSWAPISIFASFWGVSFLTAVYHYSATRGGEDISLIWIGVALGSPLIGWWSDKIKSRRLPLIVSAVIATISATAILYLGAIPHLLMQLLLFGYGLGAASQMLSFAVIHDINPTKILGTANGINNMFVTLGGLLLLPLVGLILNSTWNHHDFIQGVPAYSPSDFHLALLFIPIVGVLNILVSVFCIKETLK